MQQSLRFYRFEYLKNQALIDEDSAEQFANEGGIAIFLPDDCASTDLVSSTEALKRIQVQEAEYEATLEIERGILKELKTFSREHPIQSAELSEQLQNLSIPWK